MKTHTVLICQKCKAPLHQPRPDGEGCHCDPEHTMMARQVQVVELPRAREGDPALVVLLAPGEEPEVTELVEDNYVCVTGPRRYIAYEQIMGAGGKTVQLTIKTAEPVKTDEIRPVRDG